MPYVLCSFAADLPIMLNRVFLMGNLVADPVLRYTQSGTSVATFRLAVNDSYTTPTGERKEIANYFDVVVWKKQAVNVANFLKKGRRALVEGRLSSRTYENKEGQKVYKVEIVALSVRFLDRPGTSPEATAEAFAPSLDEGEGLPADDIANDHSSDEFYG
jgi:single-strand DNA-binding protein